MSTSKDSESEGLKLEDSKNSDFKVSQHKDQEDSDKSLSDFEVSQCKVLGDSDRSQSDSEDILSFTNHTKTLEKFCIRQLRCNI